ncbi:MAG: M20/M25/M40 family metallo-hydrolase, partial [Fimbriimonadaceae bacterium]
NAIEVAAAAIAQMKIGRIGPETVANVGTIQGGTATNVVPAECVVRCEARSTSVDELDAQIDHMIQCFEAAAERFGATVEVEHDRHYRNYSIDPDHRVVRVGVEASRRLGMEPELRTTLGGSDANIFNAKGVPSIVLATGMKEIHTHNENVSRKDLVDTARLALEIIRVAAGR